LDVINIDEMIDELQVQINSIKGKIEKNKAEERDRKEASQLKQKQELI
jgi:hypothetical protein